jgi:hypothetical protein
MLKAPELFKELNKHPDKLDLLVVLGMSKLTLNHLAELKSQAEKVLVVDANEEIWRKAIEQKNDDNILFQKAVISATAAECTFYSFNLLNHDGLVDFSTQASAPRNLAKVAEYKVKPVLPGDLINHAISLQAGQKIGLVIDIGQEGEAVLSSLSEHHIDHLAWCLLAPATFATLDHSELGLTIQSFAEEALTGKKWFSYCPIKAKPQAALVDYTEREIELAFLRDENRLLESQSRKNEEKIRLLSDELASVSAVSIQHRNECINLARQLSELESELKDVRHELAQAQIIEDVSPVFGMSEDVQAQILKLNAQIDLVKELLFGRSESPR